MSKEIASFGEDFLVEQVDRDYAGSRKEALKVDGASGITSIFELAISGAASGFGPAESKSGAGAIDPSKMVTLLTTTGAAQALTLADGTKVGQLKVVAHVVDGGSGVITPAHATNFTTATLTNLYDCVVMMWTGLTWQPILATGAAAFA